ncbi:hypothetical protein HNQ94_002791 [Salirhabdus euzebyi]|uniref:Uncharacterized protein n=1 Tax=Salirhabdus euzebyi TaxID=394506 RepID=A0A841Q7D6_9BACI|nr:hypothetical protein [Salirhabdus euzebyi]MBB6454316.1 hypothetical protein [Salirhabdus euzebyi]
MDGLAIIIALIIGAISAFSGQKDKDQKQQKPRPVNRPKPTPTPSGRTYPEEASHEKTSREVYQEQARTTHQYSDEIQSLEIGSGEITDKGRKTPRKKVVQQKKASASISMKKQLTKKRIAESIIMSEVLGRPRAHKPYDFNYKNKFK